MDLKDILTWKINDAFASTLLLVDLIPADRLDWKPADDNNWWTIAQLLHHLGSACGRPIAGFVTGDWGCPEMDPAAMAEQMKDMKPEDMLPKAEACAAVTSIDEAKAMLAADQALALETLAGVSQETLLTTETFAPWAPGQVRSLGYFVDTMIDHLHTHKTQLFYALKTLGVPVNTGHLWASAD